MKQKQDKFPRRWLVRLYDTTGFCFDSLEIVGQFQWEASKEAEDYAARQRKCDDWTMVPVN